VENAASVELSQLAWGGRAVRVLRSPRPVFATLHDDRDEVAFARQEAVTALVFLAGIGGVLAAPATGRLLDDPSVDGLLIAVVAMVQGLIYGVFGYWLGGALLLLGTDFAGASATYRQARHVLAFAAAPLALSLVTLWPLRIAVFGGDVFRSGGSDEGTLGTMFVLAEVGFIAWSTILVVIGVRAALGLSWARAVAGSAPLAAVPVGLVLLAVLR
jgi:Yip1 domain